MKITKIKIEKIKEYENNAKKHPQWQIDQIKKSIQEFGFNDPVAIDENNVIIEGHGRLIALKQLGYEEVEVIKLKHLTDVQKKKYILAHNKLTMNTGFEFDVLNEELDAIAQLDEEFNLNDIGFDVDEVEVDENQEEHNFDDAEKEGEDNSNSFDIKKINKCPHCGGVI